MEKIIAIDGKEVGFRATALTPRLYRHKMGRDIIRDLNQLKRSYEKAVSAQNLKAPGEDATEKQIGEYEQAVRDAQLSAMDLEIFENVAFVMARQYDQTIPNTPEEWLEEFAVFSIYEILPEILELWQLNQQTTSTPKKNKGHRPGRNRGDLYAALCGVGNVSGRSG